MKLQQHIGYIAAIAAMIAILALQQCHVKQMREAYNLQESVLNDELTVTRNKLGQQTATIETINASYRQLQQLSFNRADSLGRELQKLAGRRTISATIATQELRIDTVLTTDTVYYTGDSCNPVYELTDLTDYRIMNIRAGRDSFSVQVREFEKLTLVNEWTRWKLFKPQTCISRYTNSNPDVEITGMRTFAVKCDCSKKGWISFAAGNVTGFALGFGSAYLYTRLHK